MVRHWAGLLGQLPAVVTALALLASPGIAADELKATQMGGAIQGTPLSLAGVTSTVAGVSLIGSQDGRGTAARFNHPRDLVTAGANLYVADTANNAIRKVVIGTGEVTTIAGVAGLRGSEDGTRTAARFNGPTGITTDGTSLFVADLNNHAIRKVVIATGVVTTLAGTAGAPGSADGTGKTARFNMPYGITTDGTNLYVADFNNYLIRKVVIATGQVTALAGTVDMFGGSRDGTGKAARFRSPHGITTDGTNLYVVDTYSGAIRKVVVATGEVTTLAGTPGSVGATDGTAGSATFNRPSGITTDGRSLYLADTENYSIRRIVIATGEVTTLAGRANSLGATDGIGAAASFIRPEGITSDGTNLYIADRESSTIRKIVVATGAVTTLAGTPGWGKPRDGKGATARLTRPFGITTDGTNLYVSDFGAIRKVTIAGGEVTTLAGAAGLAGSTDGTGTAARLGPESPVTTDGVNLYVADWGANAIRKVVIATGEVTTLAGSHGSCGAADGTGTAATFCALSGVTTDGTNLYVAESISHTIRKVVIATGEVTTLAGSPGSGGARDGTGSAARFNNPSAITTDGTNLYVTEADNDNIRKIVIATATVTTLAGAGSRGTDEGNGAAARIFKPRGITTDGTNLYVADWGSNAVIKVALATGTVTKLAGASGSAGSTDATGAAASFWQPFGVTTDGTSLYVTDSRNNTIRKID